MITFILPGYSPTNKKWAAEVAKTLDLTHEIRPVEWEHWDNKEEHFFAEDKAKKLLNVIQDQKINIIAKSIGTYVAAHLAHQVKTQIQKLILCGIPTKFLAENNLDTNIYQNLKLLPPERIVVLQNELDPVGSYEEINKLINKIDNKIKVIKTPRQDHEYPYYQDFQKYLV